MTKTRGHITRLFRPRPSAYPRVEHKVFGLTSVVTLSFIFYSSPGRRALGLVPVQPCRALAGVIQHEVHAAALRAVGQHYRVHWKRIVECHISSSMIQNGQRAGYLEFLVNHLDPVIKKNQLAFWGEQ